MRREQAEYYFGQRVPDRFRADTGEAGRDEVERVLDESRGFFANCARHQVVAEVVEAERCMAGVEVGHRYVIQGANLDLGQTTGPVCVFLTAMLVQRVAAAFERYGGAGPVATALAGAHCTDPGPAVGGFGGVKVRMWIEPIPD